MSELLTTAENWQRPWSKLDDDIDDVNRLLADAAQDLYQHWAGVNPSEAVFMAYCETAMPAINTLSNRRQMLIEKQSSSSATGSPSNLRGLATIEQLAAALNWSEQELEHARASIDDGGGYDEECVILTHSGRELRTPALPESCSYIRVTQQGFELAYWNSDEITESSEDVIGALIGALKNNVEAPATEDLSSSFDTRRGADRQVSLLWHSHPL